MSIIEETEEGMSKSGWLALRYITVAMLFLMTINDSPQQSRGSKLMKLYL